MVRWPVWWILALAVAVTMPLTLYWWSLVMAGIGLILAGFLAWRGRVGLAAVTISPYLLPHYLLLLLLEITPRQTRRQPARSAHVAPVAT